MLRFIIAVLLAGFVSQANAQSYPSPTFNNLTVQGTATLPNGTAATNLHNSDSRVLWGPQSGINGVSGNQYGTPTYPGGPYGSNTLTLGPGNTIWNGSQLTLSGSPYGWGNSATVLCLQTFMSALSPCGVAGGVANANGYATYGGRDVATFIPTIWGPGPRIWQTPASVIANQAGTFTATSFSPTVAYTGGQIALLALRQQVKSSDGCTATLYNWKTDGSILYTSQWSCAGVFMTPSGTGAEVDNDQAALSGTWVSSTKFQFTTPLSSGQIALLRAGMSLDSSDTPVCSGELTDWDTTGGTYVNASLGFFTQPGGGACTPTGTRLVIGDMIKLFATNPASYLYGTSRAYQMSNEYDCNNNQTPWINGVSGSQLGVTQVGYNQWCMDLSSYGSYGIGYGLMLRANNAAQAATGQRGFFTGIEFESGATNAAIEINPTGQAINIAYSTKGGDSGSNVISTAFQDWSATTGNIWASLPAHTGVWKLGNEQATASSPGLKLYSSGANTGTQDSSIIASGGTGASGTGTITASGNVIAQTGSDNTTAFQIKTASGATELSVDTQNHVVSVDTGATAGIKFFGSGGANPVIIPSCGGACNLNIESSSTGSVILKPQTDNTAAVKITTSAGTSLFTIDTTNGVATIGGNLYTSGTTPTIGTCGTSPSISGTDVSGKITIGSGTVTACTISFHATLPNAPHGVVLTPANATAAAQSTTLAYVSSISTAAWVVTGSALAGAQYYYRVE